MLSEGATFIDVGAYSSRPGAKHISEEEELQRILPVVKLLVKEFPEIIISVDTFRSEVAKQTINAGAAIINDISTGKMDTNMFATVAALQVPYIIMHMQGTPQNMQQNPTYRDLLVDIMDFFIEKIGILKQKKIKELQEKIEQSNRTREHRLREHVLKRLQEEADGADNASSRIRALELLGKSLTVSMFTDRVEQAETSERSSAEIEKDLKARLARLIGS